MKDTLRKIICFSFLVFLVLNAFAQHKKISLKDSLDRKFDLSDYIIEMNGFIPVPYIITEPALGGFGGLIAPVFLKRRPPYIDSVNGSIKITPVAPDITGAAVGYTANNSWFTGALRSGTFVKSRIKYRAGAAYVNINMSFFRALPQDDEKEFKFNIKAFGSILQAIKRIGFSNWYAGMKYFFANTDVKYLGDSLPSFVKPMEYSSIVSSLGAIVEFDNRDNIFTPDNGLKIHLDGERSDNIFGSDYDYWRMNYYTYLYKSITKKSTAGLRIDGQQVFGDPPFYLLPYLEMRGLPACMYQGRADILTELETRWDFTKRWSLMLFSGAGKAFDDWSDFGDAKLVATYGTGFRYLVARKFKLRMGIDVAKGPNDWAYYIVFGSNWMK